MIVDITDSLYYSEISSKDPPLKQPAAMSKIYILFWALPKSRKKMQLQVECLGGDGRLKYWGRALMTDFKV